VPSNRRCLDNHESSSYLKYYITKVSGNVALDTEETGTSLLRNVGNYQSIWRNITEDWNLKQFSRENL